MKFKDKKVVVTTQYRGIFFGTLTEWDEDKKEAVLTKVQNCVCWGKEVRGFIGLAVDGPIGKSRVTKAAEEIELFGITSITLCSEKAIGVWESEPWFD